MSVATVLTFSSAKGGSGKTVTCVSIARILARLGARVLMIDADIDTSGMTLLFIDEILAVKQAAGSDRRYGVPNLPSGLFDEIVTNTVQPTVLGDRLALIPTQYELSPLQLTNPEIGERLTRALNFARSRYDYVLIDAQAGADPAALAAADSADRVVIVSEYDPVSAQGVKRLQQIHPTAFSYERTWILYNKVLPEIAGSVGTLLQIEKHLTPIPWDAEVVRAYVRSSVAINMDAPNPYTLALVESVETLFGRVLGDAVNEWRAGAAAALRAPISSQLERIDAALDEIERRRIQLRLRAAARRRRWLMLGSVAFGLAVAAAIATILFTSRTDELRITLLSTEALAGVSAVAALLVSSTRRGEHDYEYELELARLERKYRSFDDERRLLATSASSVQEALGPRTEGSEFS